MREKIWNAIEAFRMTHGKDPDLIVINPQTLYEMSYPILTEIYGITITSNVTVHFDECHLYIARKTDRHGK